MEWEIAQAIGHPVTIPIKDKAKCKFLKVLPFWNHRDAFSQYTISETTLADRGVNKKSTMNIWLIYVNSKIA